MCVISSYGPISKFQMSELRKDSLLLHLKSCFRFGQRDALRANTQSPPPKLGNNDVSGSIADSTVRQFREIRVENLDMRRIRVWVLLQTSRRVSRSQIQLFSKPSFSDFGFGESAWVFAPAEHFTPSRIEPNRSFASAFETVVVRKFKAPVESQPPGSVRLSLFTVFSVKCGTLVASPATSQQPVRAGTVCAEAFTVSHETNA